MSQRTRRLDELLRQEIGAILAREVTDPRIGFATITDVETAPDLRHAKVWVSIIGSADERARTLAALERAMVYVRRELGQRLRLKRIPELHVREDDSAERGTRVLRLLAELEAGHDAEGIEDDTLPTPVARIGREGDAEEPDAAPNGADPVAPPRAKRGKRTERPTGPGERRHRPSTATARRRPTSGRGR